MRVGVFIVVVVLGLVGCGGEKVGRHEVKLSVSDYTQNIGVSVDAIKPGTTDECRDDRGANWCSTTAESGLKEVRFWSDDLTTDYEEYELFVKNSDSGTGSVRVMVVTGGFVVVDRVVSLNAGSKVRVGYVERDGTFFGANGF